MADVISAGPPDPPGSGGRPRGRPSRAALGVLVAAGLLALAVPILITSRGASRPSGATPGSTRLASAPNPTRPSAPRCTTPTPAAGPPVGGAVAVLIANVRPDLVTFERHDPTATQGPWTVVVRRADGSLAHHSAVVTFPVPGPGAGVSVVVPGASGGAAGRLAAGTLTWPLAGGYARLRGDLDRAETLAVAAATTVTAGRPVIHRAPTGFAATWTGPYRPPVDREARYSSPQLGVAGWLGNALVFIDVSSGGGGPEDTLFTQQVTPSGTVGSQPAVLTNAFGGNGGLAWQPAPGMVAYLGYSGGVLDRQAVAALHCLAARARLVGPAEWRATHPQVMSQPNNP